MFCLTVWDEENRVAALTQGFNAIKLVLLQKVEWK